MNKKRLKSLKICELITLAFGIAFLISSIFIYVHGNNFIKNGEETTATIVSIISTGSSEDSHAYVKVEYYIDGIKYFNELNAYHSGMKEGQLITIKYLPNNPNEIIYAENEYLLFWVFFGVGLAFTITSIILVFVIKNRKNNFDEAVIQINNKLRKKIKTNLIVISILTIIIMGICICLSVWLYCDEIPNRGVTSATSVSIIILIVFAVIITGGILSVIQLYRDLKYVNKGNFIIVSGTVKNQIWDTLGEGAPTIEGAVIWTDDNEEIKLSVGELIIGEKYTFQYAPLTKTAVVIDGECKKNKSFHMTVNLPIWSGAFIFLCMAFIFGALFLSTYTQVDNLVKNGIVTKATVDEVRVIYNADDGDEYVVFINYEANGTIYREKLPFNIQIQVGDILEIRYMPDNPSKFQWIHDEYAIPIIFGGGATISLFASLSFFIVWLIKRRKSILEEEVKND